MKNPIMFESWETKRDLIMIQSEDTQNNIYNLREIKYKRDSRMILID